MWPVACRHDTPVPRAAKPGPSRAHLGCSSCARSTSVLPSARGGRAGAPGPSPASSVTTSGRLRSAAASAASPTTWPQACHASPKALAGGHNRTGMSSHHNQITPHEAGASLPEGQTRMQALAICNWMS